MRYRSSAAFILLLSSAFCGMQNCFAQSGVNQGQSNDQQVRDSGVPPSNFNNNGYQQRPATSRAGSILQLIESAIPKINVDTTSGSPNVRVKAPFVNVDVKGGQSNVKVNAPFVNVNTAGPGSGVNVDAPFVHVNRPLSTTPQTTPHQPLDQSQGQKQHGAPPPSAVSGQQPLPNQSQPGQ